jgi:hypothetical protein
MTAHDGSAPGADDRTHVRCAKCGGESSYCHNRYEDDHGEWRERWRVECFGHDHRGCGARGRWCYSLADAVKAWNDAQAAKPAAPEPAVADDFTPASALHNTGVAPPICHVGEWKEAEPADAASDARVEAAFKELERAAASYDRGKNGSSCDALLANVVKAEESLRAILRHAPAVSDSRHELRSLDADVQLLPTFTSVDVVYVDRGSVLRLIRAAFSRLRSAHAPAVSDAEHSAKVKAWEQDAHPWTTGDYREWVARGVALMRSRPAASVNAELLAAAKAERALAGTIVSLGGDSTPVVTLKWLEWKIGLLAAEPATPPRPVASDEGLRELLRWLVEQRDYHQKEYDKWASRKVKNSGEQHVTAEHAGSACVLRCAVSYAERYAERLLAAKPGGAP